MVDALSAYGLTYFFEGASPAVTDVAITVGDGETVAVVGPSGSGKSTLLHLLAGIMKPASGRVEIGGSVISDLDDDARAEIRLREVGLVFQFAELLPELTLRENVELPLRLLRQRSRIDRVEELLSELEVLDVADRLPSQVSGGERQRGAVARALVHNPRVVLADEPTGALDAASGELVLELLMTLGRAQGAALLLVTHDHGIADRCGRVVSMADGRLRT